MAKLILVDVDIIPSPNCPNTVQVQYKFFGQPIGGQYSIPKGPRFTFPGGGAQSMSFSTGGKLYLYFIVNNQEHFASMGNVVIPPNTTPQGQLKVYKNYTSYGLFQSRYKVV